MDQEIEEPERFGGSASKRRHFGRFPDESVAAAIGRQEFEAQAAACFEFRCAEIVVEMRRRAETIVHIAQHIENRRN
jgi:hypothetical protein